VSGEDDKIFIYESKIPIDQLKSKIVLNVIFLFKLLLLGMFLP
jgi:hypothetical protein